MGSGRHAARSWNDPKFTVRNTNGTTAKRPRSVGPRDPRGYVPSTCQSLPSSTPKESLNRKLGQQHEPLSQLPLPIKYHYKLSRRILNGPTLQHRLQTLSPLERGHPHTRRRALAHRSFLCQRQWRADTFRHVRMAHPRC